MATVCSDAVSSLPTLETFYRSGILKKKKVIAIIAVRDCDGVIFGRRSSPKWESSSFGQGMALAETTSAHDGILRTQLRTYGIASIVPESDDA